MRASALGVSETIHYKPLSWARCGRANLSRERTRRTLNFERHVAAHYGWKGTKTKLATLDLSVIRVDNLMNKLPIILDYGVTLVDELMSKLPITVQKGLNQFPLS